MANDKSLLPSFAGLLAAIVLSIGTIHAATHYVSTTGKDSADGLSEKTAWRTIAHAAKKAKAGDTVKIKGGTYNGEYVVVANSGAPRMRPHRGALAIFEARP